MGVGSEKGEMMKVMKMGWGRGGVAFLSSFLIEDGDGKGSGGVGSRRGRSIPRLVLYCGEVMK